MSTAIIEIVIKMPGGILHHLGNIPVNLPEPLRSLSGFTTDELLGELRHRIEEEL